MRAWAASPNTGVSENVSELLEQVNTEWGQHNARGHRKNNAKGENAKGRATCRLENNNGVPMHTVLETGGQTLLRAEIYRPVAVYLRLLALLVATYLGTAQCHNYSNNRYNKGGDGEHRHARINVLVLTWWVGRTGRGVCRCRGRLILILATAKEQIKSASEDEWNIKAGEKPEQVWGFIAIKPRLIYVAKATR
jgi:hypothetical protein